MAKIRKGFVSNSSSSSFIVISEGNQDQTLYFDDGVFILGDDGETEFGWQVTEYNDIYSKINFCYLQARDGEKEDFMNMLYKVLKEKFPEMKDIISILGDDEDDKIIQHPINGDPFVTKYAYVDHQSSSSEGANLEMFVSEETLKNFLFNSSSYIKNDNDNH